MARLLLFIDDNIIIQIYIANFLKSLGYKVVTYKTANEGYDYFKKNKDNIDLIITDLNLPYMSSFDFIDKVREEREDIPIIALSYINGEQLKNIKNKVNGYFSKDFDENELSKFIEELLS